MSCVVCNHDNFSAPALDDLEAACGCCCHDSPDEDICPDCDNYYNRCICYGDEN